MNWIVFWKSASWRKRGGGRQELTNKTVGSEFCVRQEEAMAGYLTLGSIGAGPLSVLRRLKKL